MPYIHHFGNQRFRKRRKKGGSVFPCLSAKLPYILESNPHPNLIRTSFCRYLNLLTSNDDYSGRTAPLTSKRFILYIYSTNIGTEYFKHVIYSPFFPLQNAVCFTNLTYLVSVLFTFHIQDVLKSKI